ncbi:MAG: hypothetical protein GXO09_04525 [Crenarchaeota archaeon]|nr:hypothetical protein [Thermoproteota archaeon]
MPPCSETLTPPGASILEGLHVSVVDSVAAEPATASASPPHLQGLLTASSVSQEASMDAAASRINAVSMGRTRPRR